MLKHTKEDRQRNISSGAPFVLILSLVAFFLYIYFANFSSLALRETGIWGILNHNNTVKYCAGLVVLALAFFLLRAITRFVPRKASDTLFATELPRAATIAVFFAYLLFLGWYLQRYIFYTELEGGIFGANPAGFAWHQLPISLVLGYVGAVVFWMLWTAFRGKDTQNATAYLAYTVAILISYVTFLFISTESIYGDLHHAMAYTDSVYNVYSGAPYNGMTTGVYGHYGLFFGLLLKIFRGNSVTLSHMIALSGALSTAACAYVIHKLTKKNYLRIAAILACIMSLSVLRRGNYWQVQPHRVLFPLLLVAFVTYLATKNAYTKPKMALGYLLCTLAVVWNTESGLFCAVAYTIALIVHFYQSDVWYAKKMWLRYLTLIGGAVSTLVGAILIVNLYNLTVGGGFILKDFFFPLGVDDYMNRVLKSDLIGGVQVWILILVLFVMLLFLGLYHTKFFRRDEEESRFDAFAPVFVALAVVGLLNFSYYANRAAYMNLDICAQTACLSMTVFADRYLDRCRDIFRKKMTLSAISSAAMSLVSLVVLTVLATQVVFCTYRLTTKYEDGVWDVEAFEARTEQFEALVPEDYMVIGMGSSMYQLQLERPAKYCYRDMSDLYVGGTEVSEQMVEDAVAHGKVAFYIIYEEEDVIDLMQRILSRANFTLTAEGSVGEAIVLCFEKQ